MRHPVPLVIGGVTGLLVLGSPFLGVRYALPDESSLPRSSESHEVLQLLNTEFGSLSTDALYIVSPDRRLSADETRDYALAVSRVAGVSAVTSAAGTFAHSALVAGASPAATGFDGTRASWISVGLAGNPQGPQAEAAVSAVRSIPAPAPLLLGGVAAHLVDTRQTLGRALPWAVAIVAVSTLVLLFLFTGSVLIPIKAVVLNLLSLSATFGAAVWIFQDGHLRWLLGDFQTNGAVELTTPILLFAVAFGLSMDYELFLLSRIKEEYERLHNNTAAVAAGLEKTGRLVTYAALLFVIVMITFATSGLSVLKLVGVGLGLAVFMDATLVRAILVPAVMRLAGRANWWAPRVLRELHERIGLRDGVASGEKDLSAHLPSAPASPSVPLPLVFPEPTMDSKNLFQTPTTYRLIRAEYLVGLMVLAAVALAHLGQIRWAAFVGLFLYIDVIGYLPGVIAHKLRRTAYLPRGYYVLYNTMHSLITAAAVGGLWCLIVRPEWALLALPLHLFGDRALFGNFYKSFGIEFEPSAHPDYVEVKPKLDRPRRAQISALPNAAAGADELTRVG